MRSNRRDNGSGNICYGSDGRWHAKVYTGRSVNGKRTWKQFTGKTEAEVKAKLREYNREVNVEQGDTKKGVLYSDFLYYWLYNKKIFSLKPSSFDRLESTVNNHVVPSLGSELITDIIPNDVQNLINRKVRDGLSYSSVKKIYDAVNSSLKDATFPPTSLKYNPAQNIELPRKSASRSRSDVKYFYPNEVEAIKKEIVRNYSTGSPVYPYGQAYILILNTGLRCGELLGLRRKDFSASKGTLTITMNQTTTKKRDMEGVPIGGYETKRSGTVKTRNSSRTIKLNPAALHAVEQLISRFPKAEYIVNNSKGNPLSASDIVRTFNRIMDNAGVEKNGRGVHSLRHTFATYMFKNGVDVKVVSDILGHSSVGITYDIYVHVLDEIRAEAMDSLPEI